MEWQSLGCPVTGGEGGLLGFGFWEQVLYRSAQVFHPPYYFGILSQVLLEGDAKVLGSFLLWGNFFGADVLQAKPAYPLMSPLKFQRN